MQAMSLRSMVEDYIHHSKCRRSHSTHVFKSLWKPSVVQSNKLGTYWLVCSTKAEASDAMNASKAPPAPARGRLGLVWGVRAAVRTPRSSGEPRLQATSSPG